MFLHKFGAKVYEFITNCDNNLSANKYVYKYLQQYLEKMSSNRNVIKTNNSYCGYQFNKTHDNIFCI